MILRRSIKIIFLVLFTVSLMLVAFRVSVKGAAQESAVQENAAQESGVTIENMRVDIWPEYDQPAALIIYHLTVAPQVSLPATLAIRVPAASGRPHAVAMQDVAGLYNLNYEFVAAGEWNEIRFTTPVPDVRIEYYDPSLTKNGSTRDFVFRWPGNYTVNNFAVSVQQPVNATEMTFRPDLGSGRQGEDGLTYYSLVAGKVNAGTSFELALSYNKADDSLTSPQQFQAAAPNQPVSSTTSGRVTLDQMLPWAFGGLGLLLISAGSFWYWKTGRTPTPSEQRQRHTRRTPAAAGNAAAAANEGSGVFCTQCGKRAGGGDVFCRACGTKLH